MYKSKYVALCLTVFMEILCCLNKLQVEHMYTRAPATFAQ